MANGNDALRKRTSFSGVAFSDYMLEELDSIKIDPGWPSDVSKILQLDGALTMVAESFPITDHAPHCDPIRSNIVRAALDAVGQGVPRIDPDCARTSGGGEELAANQ